MSFTLPRLKRGIPVMEFLLIFNLCGLIPRSLLRRDSGVGWVESFGVAQDSLRDTHRCPRWVSALRAPTHPTISLEVRLLRYPASCCGVVHSISSAGLQLSDCLTFRQIEKEDS